MEPNTVNQKYQSDHQKTKTEDKTKQSTSPVLPALKGLIILIAIICIASAVAIAVWLNLSADGKANDMINSSTTTALSTTTIGTITTTTTVITPSASTTSTILPVGTITHQYEENYMAYLACPDSMRVIITYAFFGVSSCASCNCGYCVCSLMNITSTMDNLCTNSTGCSFNVDHYLLGDGCVHYHKTLVVTYYCS